MQREQARRHAFLMQISAVALMRKTYPPGMLLCLYAAAAQSLHHTPSEPLSPSNENAWQTSLDVGVITYESEQGDRG